MNDDLLNNDFDRISSEIGECIQEILRNTHISDGTDYASIINSKCMLIIIKMQRLQDWVKGLAEAYRV